MWIRTFVKILSPAIARNGKPTSPGRGVLLDVILRSRIPVSLRWQNSLRKRPLLMPKVAAEKRATMRLRELRQYVKRAMSIVRQGDATCVDAGWI